MKDMCIIGLGLCWFQLITFLELIMIPLSGTDDDSLSVGLLRSNWNISKYMELQFAEYWPFYSCFRVLIIPPAQRSILVSLHPSVRPSVRLSVRPASCVRSVAPTVLVGSISYLYISERRHSSCSSYSEQCLKKWHIRLYLEALYQLCLAMSSAVMWYEYWLISDIWNHLQLDCLLNSLFKVATNKISKALHHWLLCAGNPLMTGGFPSQRASNSKRTSISWRHHKTFGFALVIPENYSDWFCLGK